jgi:hypothetical protein
MTITPDEDDALEFTAEVQSLMDGLLRTHAPSSLSVVKIDNWFGPRWLNFSGKALGALGIWKTRLTIPPFVPNRVVWQRTFLGPSYDDLVDAKPIHIKTKSMKALKRYVAEVAPGVAIVWYSGNSAKSGQGSMMVHVPTVRTICHCMWDGLSVIRGVLQKQ